MNEYPNSVSNNMVNTTPFRDNLSSYEDEYNIQISNLPRTDCSYKTQKGTKLKTLLIAGAIVAATLGASAYQSHLQYQSMMDNTAVVEEVAMPGGATLQVTKNPLYSYIETPDGQHVAEYNGMRAEDWAKSYVEEAQTKGKQM